MIIESIEIKNFMCYAGENQFEFKEGMNVIIGDNGYGKSKLYDAFYWAMYDQCFDTNEKEWKRTSLIGRAIISDKALFESQDGIIEASVQLTFRDVERAEQFTVTRRLSAQKTEGEVITDTQSEEEITHRRVIGKTGKVVTNPDEIDRIKKRILPENIRPYMWFQGEQVESIIDFGESDSLTRAINVLSNISRFDDIQEVAEAWYKSAQDQYHRKMKALSSDKSQTDQLELERARVMKRVEELEKDVLEVRNNLGTAEESTEKLMNQQEDASRIRELDVHRKSVRSELERLNVDERHEKVSLFKKLFTRRWVLKGNESLVELYNNKYSNYQDAKLEKKAELRARLKADNLIMKELQTRLPVNVPEPVYVEKMLVEEKCLVCNREAVKGSEAWNSIKQLLERTKPKELAKKEAELGLHDFESDFKKLSQTGYILEQDISGVDIDIEETFKSLKRIENRRRSKSEEWETIDREFNTAVSESRITSDSANNVLNKLTSQIDLAKRFSIDLARKEADFKHKEEELNQIEERLGKLVKEELPKWLEEKKQLLEDFNYIAHSTRNRVFKGLVSQLESEANQHYRDMMQDNLSATGLIKLVESSKGNYMPRLVDDHGNPLMQLNTGNIILIKLATIMAIISARQGSRDTDLYTLITDAPMSVFGEDYTLGFCKTVSKVYKQSIIMSKEFYKNENLRRQLLTDKDINLGKVYMITPSIPENQRLNRNSLTTNISPLN